MSRVRHLVFGVVHQTPDVFTTVLETKEKVAVMGSGDIGEHQILEELTSAGSVPLKNVVVYHERIWTWFPDTGHMAMSKADPTPLHLACLGYLKDRNAVVSSIDNFADYARMHEWSNLTALDGLLEDWKKRRKDAGLPQE